MTWRYLLQLKRDRFTEELESYAKLVEEFASYGEMSDVPRYLKKAQALDAKLQAAADKVKLQAVADKVKLQAAADKVKLQAVADKVKLQAAADQVKLQAAAYKVSYRQRQIR